MTMTGPSVCDARRVPGTGGGRQFDRATPSRRAERVAGLAQLELAPFETVRIDT